MTEIERIQFLEANLARQLQWIAHAETKSSFVFASSTAMLGLLAAVSPKTLDAWTCLSVICTSIAVIGGLASLIFLLLAAFPRTDGPEESLIYFGRISRLDSAQYWINVSSLSAEDYARDLSTQCHRNAEIAKTKFSLVQRSLISLYIAVVPWGIAIYLLYGWAK